MWAVDEIIDSGHASVQVTANSFQNRSQVRALSAKTSGSALHSPEPSLNLRHPLFLPRFHKDKYICNNKKFLVNLKTWIL